MKFYPENLPSWIDAIVYWRATDVGLECALDRWVSHVGLPGVSATGLDLYGHPVTHLIPRTEIDVIHSGLFERLMFMSEVADAESRNEIGSMDNLDPFMLKTAYAHLTDAIVIDDVRGFQRDVAELMEVVNWDKQKRSISFNAHIYAKAAMPLLGKGTIEFIYGATKNPVLATGSWLDEHYYGWEGRLQAAIDLGCNEAEQVDAVFTRQLNPSLKVALPSSDITIS